MIKSFNPKTNEIELSAEFLFKMFTVYGLTPENTINAVRQHFESKYKEYFYYKNKLFLVKK